MNKVLHVWNERKEALTTIYGADFTQRIINTRAGKTPFDSTIKDEYLRLRRLVVVTILDNLNGRNNRRSWRLRHALNTGGAEMVLFARKEYKEYGARLARVIQTRDLHKIVNTYNLRPTYANIDAQVITERFPSVDFNTCVDCNDLLVRNEVFRREDNECLCSTCAHDSYFRHNDGFWYDNEEEEPPIIGRYHSSKDFLGHIPSTFDTRTPKVRIGFELEIECDGMLARESHAKNLLDAIGKYKNYLYAHCENDGSLTNGFEMVTSYTGLDVHREQLKKYFKDTSNVQGLKSHNTRTCGLHVHVCKADMNVYHATRLMRFIHARGNEGMIRAVARRYQANGRGYAKIDNTRAWRFQWLKNALRGVTEPKRQIQRLNPERHEALNFLNTNTVEFRLFRGTLKYSTIVACLEFAYMSWHFTRPANGDDLTQESFFKFISAPENRKDSYYLRRLLHARGFNVFYKAPTDKARYYRNKAIKASGVTA